MSEAQSRRRKQVRSQRALCQAPNEALQLPMQLVTPFAYAKVAPSCLAAEL